MAEILQFPQRDCGCAAAGKKCWEGKPPNDGFIFDVKIASHRLMTKEEKERYEEDHG